MSSDMVIIARTPEGLQIFDSSGSALVRQIPGALSFISSPQLIVATKESSVDVYNGRGENLVRICASSIIPAELALIRALFHLDQLLTLPETGVILLALSPNAEHLVTCTKPVKDETGQPGKNMKVWSIKDGRLVAAVPQKQVSKDHWPAIHWSGDSSAFVHCVTNTFHIYEARDAFQSYRKLTIRGVTDISLAPEGPSHNKLCAFIPEAKGSPASAGIYDWTAEAPAGGEAPPLVKKSFFRTSGAQLMWNKNGSACLVLAFTDFDVTNQSYYGEQKLHYLPSDPAKSDKACTVDLKEGPVHDVKWSPNGDLFACVAGFIPSKVMLFDANCKPIFDFGSGPYNVVRWSPFGRFLAVCGFGNLPGDIVFWDKKQSGTCRQMGAVRSPAVTADWSPDGRSFLTATVAPRLRVDNNYKLFAYHGSQLTTLPFPTLFEASWAPVTPGTFTDRPQSPERIAAAASGSGGGPSAAPASVLAPKASGYVPPHLRGAGGGVPGAGSGGAPKPQFSLAFDPNEKAGRIATASASAVVGGSSRPMSSKPLTPGAEPIIGEGSGKGAKKKSSSSKKSEAPSEAGEKQQKPSDRPGNGGDAKAKAVAQTVPAPAPNNASEEGGGLDEKAKRIRALNKKLRAISELREKIGDGAPSPEQASKLSTEEALMAELKQIELS